MAEWSVEALKEYLDQRLADLHELFETGIAELGQRLEQFRNEYGTHHDDLLRDVRQIRDEVKENAGSDRSAQRILTYVIAGAASLAAFGTLIYYLVHH